MACDAQIAAHLATFPDQSGGQPLPPKPRKSKRKAHAPRFDTRTPLSRMAGVDLTALEGIEEETALVILSEIGTDVCFRPACVKLDFPWPTVILRT
jgi:hypothetical protein